MFQTLLKNKQYNAILNMIDGESRKLPEFNDFV